MNFIKIIVSYIMKYLLGFLLVFICSAMLFFTAKDTIQSYIIKQVRMQTQEGISTIDETFEKLDLIARTIYQNDNFRKLIYQRKTLPKENILILDNCHDFIQKISTVSDYTPYMFVLFKNNDLYLSSSQCSLSFSDYYNNFLLLELQDEPENKAITKDATLLKTTIFDNAQEHHNIQHLKSVRYMYGDKQYLVEDALLYIADGTDTPIASSHIFCFILTKEYLIQNILGSEYKQDGFLYIKDIKTGTELLSYGPVPDKAREIVSNAPIKEYKIQEYYVNTAVQSKMGLQIITGISDSYIDEQIKPTQQLLMMYLWIGFVAVIVLTCAYSFSRYYGFRKVLHSFPIEFDLLNHKGVNEYQLLTQNIVWLGESRKNYQQQLDDLKNKSQAIQLENLITNGIDTPEKRSFFLDFIKKEPEFYHVALVRFQQCDKQIVEAVTINMMQFLIKRNMPILVHVHSGLTDELLLIEQTNFSGKNISEISLLFEEMVSDINKHYDVVFHIGISMVGTDLANISKCYEQARQIVQAQYMFENESAVRAYVIDNDMLNDNPITVDFLNRLYTMLVCGDYTELSKELSTIETRYIRMPYQYEAHKEQIFYSLRNVFYTVALHLNCEEMHLHLPDYKSSFACQEMMEMFLQCANWICDFIQNSKKSSNSQLRDKILRIMQEKYPDANLSAFSISQQVGISEKYFYQFWKEQTGETFATTLLHIRIDKAKEYLKQIDYTNEQIAVLTGFTTANTFYRNFQKLNGVTPKSYRDNYLAGKK